MLARHSISGGMILGPTSTSNIFGRRDVTVVSQGTFALGTASIRLGLVSEVTEVDDVFDARVLALELSGLNNSSSESLTATPLDLRCASEGFPSGFSSDSMYGSGGILRSIAVGENPIDDWKSPISLFTI